MDEIRELEKLEGAELNEAKKLLAFEVTKMVHGEEEAARVKEAAEAVFGGGMSSANMPSTEVAAADVASGINILDLLITCGLAPSKGEGRRLVQQGGVSINGEKVTAIDYTVGESDFTDGEVIIKKGKKVFHRAVIK